MITNKLKDIGESRHKIEREATKTYHLYAYIFENISVMILTDIITGNIKA